MEQQHWLPPQHDTDHGNPNGIPANGNTSPANGYTPPVHDPAANSPDKFEGMSPLEPSDSCSYKQDSNQYAIINNNGICTSCNDSDASSTKLCCLFCQLNFHATCSCTDAVRGDKTGKQVICPSTFYKSFNAVTSGQGIHGERHGNFSFHL